MKRRIAILTVNFNGLLYGGKLFRSFFNSIFNTNVPEYYEAYWIFVDAGSIDNSVEYVKAIYQDMRRSHKSSLSLYVVAIPRSIGYSNALNIGLEIALNNLRADYVVLINNDEIPVSREWLITLLYFYTRLLDCKGSNTILCLSKYRYDNSNEMDSLTLGLTSLGTAFEIRFPRGKHLTYRVAIWQTPLIACAIVFKLLKKVYGFYFNPILNTINNDVESSLRLMSIGTKVYVIDKPLILHRRSTTLKNLNKKFLVYHLRKNTLITSFMLALCSKNNLFASLSNVFVISFVHFIVLTLLTLQILKLKNFTLAKHITKGVADSIRIILNHWQSFLMFRKIFITHANTQLIKCYVLDLRQSIKFLYSEFCCQRSKA